jgi:outer membrane protein assembly factor BamE (lipoprotein component of BamABCDE complex)
MKYLCAAIVGIVLCVAACEKVVVNRGYVIEKAAFDKVVVGVDDEQSVFDKLGAPTARSSIIDEGGGYSWYYVAKRTEKNGFLDPKVVEQKTMVIRFDGNGIVRIVRRAEAEKKIKTVDEKTKTAGKGAGVFGETFGGLGKYRDAYSDKGK